MCKIRLDGQVPHWTGTHGETISSDLHGAEEPTRWMLRPQQGAETGQKRLCQREGGRLAEAPWGDCALFSETLALEGLGRHPGGS
jgi:hypothetical protein